jgi:arginase
MTRFVVVPQWQGSGSTRAMQLITGAEAIAGDLPRAKTVTIDVPAAAGDALGTGVHRASTLLHVRDAVEAAVREAPERTLVVGGDCGVAIGAVAGSLGDDPSDLAVLWIDAHPDLHSPESSATGAFHGMVLRAVLGEGADGLVIPAGTIPASRVILAGTRELDLEEELYIGALGIRMLSPADLTDPSSLADAVEATGATRVYVHVDLDVLDPAEISGLTHPQPFGVSAADLAAALRELKGRVTVAGSSLTEFAPASPAAAVDDLGVILRLVGALA